MTNFARVLIALAVSVCSVGAFMPCPAALAKSNHRARASSRRSSGAAAAAPAAARRPSALHMGWGDALGKAFANEDMAPKKNPGLKSEPNTCMVGADCCIEEHVTDADRVALSTYVCCRCDRRGPQASIPC